ncbi:MAG: nucleotide exchange factor GrpE [Patescibacteria group bacterium]
MTDNEDIQEEKTENAECVQCAEYLAGWKRAQADYANLKKEVEKEKTEFSKYANERLLETLLPAVDQFETALAFKPELASLPEEQKSKFENWYHGLSAVKYSWDKEFAALGLENIKPEPGHDFDPLLHEAVGQETAADGEDGKISRVLQAGWRLNGKLLRPAKVIIVKK